MLCEDACWLVFSDVAHSRWQDSKIANGRRCTCDERERGAHAQHGVIVCSSIPVDRSSWIAASKLSSMHRAGSLSASISSMLSMAKNSSVVLGWLKTSQLVPSLDIESLHRRPWLRQGKRVCLPRPAVSSSWHVRRIINCF